MASIKKLGDRELEIEDGCDCGAAVRYIVTSHKGEFHLEKVQVQPSSQPDDDDFWTGRRK